MAEQGRRLDSWKEIADYLGRDVRTVMRWAKDHGLPARRVAGGRGRSVFAFAEEIDEWLARGPIESATPDPEPETGPVPTAATSRWRMVSWIAAAAGALAVGIIAYAGAGGDRLDHDTLQALVIDQSLVLRDAAGHSRVIHRFDPGRVTELTPGGPQLHDGETGREVLLGVAHYLNPGEREPSKGELLNLSVDGTMRWRFSFEDEVAFASEKFTGPWGLSDWKLSAAPHARIAVAAHHTVWWASVVTILDRGWHRLGTFVNPGWIESVQWLDAGRVIAGGFNNHRDAATVAVIDAARPDGQAPDTAGTPFECVSCPRRDPLFYASLPRSEINRVTASRFNRAHIGLGGDRIVVRTTEAGGSAEGPVATAIYEFDRGLRLLQARYDDRYWDLHRQLELDGRLKHARAQCPERDGPRAIDVWTGAAWKRVRAGSQ